MSRVCGQTFTVNIAHWLFVRSFQLNTKLSTWRFHCFTAKIKLVNYYYGTSRSVSSVAKHIAICAEGLGFDFQAGQIGQCRHRCVAQALSRGDGPRHSLHAFLGVTLQIQSKFDLIL